MKEERFIWHGLPNNVTLIQILFKKGDDEMEGHKVEAHKPQETKAEEHKQYAHKQNFAKFGFQPEVKVKQFYDYEFL